MRYNINNLGSKRFEELVQVLSREIIGPGVVIFGDGPDGGREATFEGYAGYPNVRGGWGGYWVIQAKFKEIRAQLDTKDINWLKREVTKELSKYQSRKEPVRKPDNLLFFTNIILTPAATKGGRDKISEFVEELKADYGIPNMVIIGSDDIIAFLDQYKNVRTSFIELILTEDIFLKLAESVLAEKDREYPKIVQKDTAGKDVEKPFHPALEKMVARYKEIPKDSFELLDLNYLELLIYKSIQEGGDKDIIEHAFMMLQLPITKLGLNAIEMNAFGNGFRKNMIENLKRISGFETFSMNCLLCWMFFTSELRKRNLFNLDTCRLFIEVIETEAIDGAYQEMSLLDLLKAYEQLPALKESLVFPDIFSVREGNMAPIGNKLVEEFFSKDYQSAKDQLTQIWQLVDEAYRLLIIEELCRYRDAQKLAPGEIADHFLEILADPDPDPDLVGTIFTELREALIQPPLSVPKLTVLADHEIELLKDVDRWQHSDLPSIYEYYGRVSNIDIKQNKHLTDLMHPLHNESIEGMVQNQGKPFAKTFLLEISLNLSVSGVYSIMAIEHIWRRFDMELFLLDERFPEVLFMTKDCQLFPGTIIDLVCDADRAYQIEDKEKINLILLYHFKRLLVQINRQDFVQQLRDVVEGFSEDSGRMQLLLAYLNEEMSDDDFWNWLHS